MSLPSHAGHHSLQAPASVSSVNPRRSVLLSLVALFMAAIVATPASAQSNDTVTDDVERTVLTFDDVAELDELTADHATLFRLYWAFFDRPPDAEGALYWVVQYEQCVGMDLIVDSFAAGSEFAATYGEVDDDGFLDLIYRNVLGRTPDAEGRSYWTGVLDDGRASRAETMLYFAASTEFVAQHPLPSDGVPGRNCRLGGRGNDTPRSVEFIEPAPFAMFDDVTLLAPSVAVEHIGFHQSTNDAARPLVPLDSPISSSTMSSRHRDTAARGAADVAVHPLLPITSPVTGTVLRAGGYTLYCDYRDDFVVIEPDDHPGWEVKMLHITDVAVRSGDRVEAGVTVLAPTAHVLPFSSQIDAITANPSWPHVHIEIIDPSIPDRPSTGGGC